MTIDSYIARLVGKPYIKPIGAACQVCGHFPCECGYSTNTGKAMKALDKLYNSYRIKRAGDMYSVVIDGVDYGSGFDFPRVICNAIIGASMNRRMDCIIASRLFNLPIVVFMRGDEFELLAGSSPLLPYSTDLSEAAKVLATLDNPSISQVGVTWEVAVKGGRTGYAGTLPMAICRAFSPW